ncbi:MAG: hypothetical protein GY832_11750 [Chloroflexi bacterium]|nr:hypothetical protein [Chloroflexota bacterium]
MAKKDKGKDALLNLDEARRIWPGKKRGLQTEFANFCRQHKDWEELLEDKGIAMCVSVMRANQLYREGFWPMFATFVNQRRWEEVT